MSLLIPFSSALGGQLTLAWRDNSSNEQGFQIERASSAVGPFNPIGLAPIDATSYVDVGLVDGAMYCYRVRAYNIGGNSAYTNVACGTTPQSTLLLTVTTNGNGRVTSTPAGIDCGAVCQAKVLRGASITLTATPAAGFAVSRWTGCAPPAGAGPNTCIVTMDIARTVGVEFIALPPPEPAPSDPTNLTVQ